MEIRPSDVEFRIDTNPFLAHPTEDVKVIFSTYQSSPVVGAGASGYTFDMGIFDEAHKTTGREGGAFSYALSDERLRIRKRLFFTATPRHYDIRHRDKEGEFRVRSMDDPQVYGLRAHTLSLRVPRSRASSARTMASSSEIVVFCLLSLATPAFAGDQIYSYTDDSGALNFTTERDWIPEQYRNQAVPLKLEVSPPVETPPLPLLRVVTSSGEYRMGDHDSRIDATWLAIDDAKRQALEQIAVYLESITQVKDLDVTRDEIRAYTAGIVMVLKQQTSTRLEDGEIVIHVDLTAQVDEQEVIQAIAALRENESAKQELVSLRTKTDQLRQQLNAANQALAMANTPAQIQALTIQRQRLLDRMQADALIAQAKTETAALATETGSPSSLARLRHFLGAP
jgi:hypothetical protein